MATSFLITGPPGSGKSRAALQLFLATPDSTLLTPTSTMAEHIRNELARAHAPVRPNRILTLAKFLEPFTELQPAPDSLIHLLIRLACPDEFPGYHRAFADLIQEVPPAAMPGRLGRIANEVEDQLAEHGMAFREPRLTTAQPVSLSPVILDGFFTFSPNELALLERLAEQTSVTVTLPDWAGSSDARARLLEHGFTEQRLERTFRHSRRSVQAALSLDQEVEQIALRILEHAAQGRAFREIGVILRSRSPYAPALESVFARFGIPARFHFTSPLSEHPAIQYLSGLIRQSDPLPLVRMPVSGIGATPAGDKLDFEMREALPDQFLPAFIADKLNFSRQFRRPAEWAASLKPLRALIPAPEITDGVDQTQLRIWRSTAAALDAFEIALDTTAQALDDQRVALDQFWPHVEAVLSIEKLRVPDRRRNVVNVIDVFEARQWELAIAFVPGLSERHFPQYHRENPLLPDPRAQRQQEEERFLFELATSRATEETMVSYARFNDKGDPQLRSFFLEDEGEPVDGPRVLPHVERREALPDFHETDLRKRHAKLSSSSLESFLQCPFQFFARKTLRLRRRPPAPRDRLDNLLQGTILHRALAEGSLEPAFEDECRKRNIPLTYRKEAVRLELLRHFEAWEADRQWPLFWPSLKEQTFDISLTKELSLRGRIDRLDTGPKGEAIVIDYKYSAAATLKDRMKGDPIQGGLYLLAAQRAFDLKPAGMFYCGLRQAVTWEGWHTGVPGLTLGEWTTPAGLQELIDAAKQTAIETFETIAAGNVEVHPKDPSKCRYCDYNEICRVESQAKTKAAHESFG